MEKEVRQTTSKVGSTAGRPMRHGSERKHPYKALRTKQTPNRQTANRRGRMSLSGERSLEITLVSFVQEWETSRHGAGARSCSVISNDFWGKRGEERSETDARKTVQTNSINSFPPSLSARFRSDSHARSDRSEDKQGFPMKRIALSEYQT